MILDAHHHLWHYSPAEYDWITPAMPVLRRDFLPGDLEQTLTLAGVSAAIAVQARQTIEETTWLLDLAARHPILRGVVGWLPLADPDVEHLLAPLAATHPKLRALRHVVQAEPDDRFLDRPDFNRGVALLARYHLRYDILIFDRHLPAAIDFVDRHPNQTFILDHIAKPKIKTNELDPWRKHITALARRPNVYCKLSGMATEADWQSWTPAQLHPYFTTVLEAFTPNRLMFGSDWPVCLLATSYQRWLATVRSWLTPLSPTEQSRILSGTAIEAYALT